MTDKECCKKEGGCECGHDHTHEHAHNHPSVEDIAYNNHFLLNTLIKHLIDKKVIEKDELEKELQAIAKEQAAAHEEAHATDDKPKEE